MLPLAHRHRHLGLPLLLLLQNNILSRLNLPYPFLKVLDGHEAEIELRGELCHVGVEIHTGETADNGLLLGDAHGTELLGGEGLGEAPSEALEVAVVEVLEVVGVVGEVVQERTAQAGILREDFLHFSNSR